MMFYHADEFFAHLLGFRLCFIGGRLGSGKTLLSVAIADYLMKNALVDGVIINLPSVFPTSIGEDDGTLIGRCVIFDEAHQTLDSRDALVNDRSYGAYARKLRSVWLMPSKNKIDIRMRDLTVKRWLDLGGIGWLYRYTLQADDEEDIRRGWFLLRHPEKYFGWYLTGHIPTDDGKLLQRYQRSIYLETRGKGIQTGVPVAEYQEALAMVAGGDF